MALVSAADLNRETVLDWSEQRLPSMVAVGYFSWARCSSRALAVTSGVDPSFFAGATGLGKTWLACALAQYACRQGHSALYLRVPRLAEELRILHGAGSFRRWLDYICQRIVGQLGLPSTG